MSKSLSRLIVGSFFLLGAPFVLPESTLQPAQAKPSAGMKRCVDIGVPKVGDVCYLSDSKYIRRKEDKDNWREDDFLWERQLPGWVMTHVQAKFRKGGFGSVRGPWVSMTSGTGNISINTSISRAISELDRTSIKLKGELKGCKPPVCGELKSSLDSVSERISELKESQKVAIQKGKNEGANIRVKSYVKHTCPALFPCYYGGGVSKNVDYWAYYRYVGTPSRIKNEANKVMALANTALRSSKQAATPAPNPTPTPAPKGDRGWQRETSKLNMCKKRYQNNMRMLRYCLRSTKLK